MNKFTKVLLFVLLVATLATVFAVSTFAAKIEKKSGHLATYTFETSEPDSVIDINPDGAGQYQVKAAENGNKYVEFSYAPAVLSGANDSYVGGPYQANKSYSFAEYPYLAIDLDMTKTTAEWAGGAYSVYYYVYGNLVNDLGEIVEIVSSQKQTGYYSINLSTFVSNLPKEAFEWAHVTLISHYNVIGGVDYISLYVYVNGECVYENLQFHKLATDKYPASMTYAGTYRINNGGTKGDVSKKNGYDNWQINLYNAGYTLDEVAGAVYTEDYELPYGLTVASIGEGSDMVVFDDLQKAVDAAQPGDTIKLVRDVKETVSVEKTIIIDTNKYGADGLATGEYYELHTASTTLVAQEADGFVEFLFLQNASVEVYWDDCPYKIDDPDAECFCGYEHIMAMVDESVMLNSTPVYTGTIPTFDIVDGLSKSFVGWSYTPGGEAEPLRPVTQEDIDGEFISLYPVYEIVQYDIAVVSDSGAIYYYMQDEINAAVAQVSGNSVLKLLDNVVYGETITINKNITIDLNGFALMRIGETVSDFEAIYNEETGEYEKGDQIGDSYQNGAVGYMFYSASSGFTFTIKSSRPGATVASFAASTERLLSGDKVVDTNSEITGYSNFYSLYPANSTFNILGENITFHLSTLFYGEHGTNDASLCVNIDGGTFYSYKGGNEGLLGIRRGGTHTIKNATFDCNGSLLLKLSNYNKNQTFIFENCTIVDSQISIQSNTDVIRFINCRIDAPTAQYNRAGTVIYDKNTSFVTLDSYATIPEGLEIIPTSNTVAVPALDLVEYDSFNQNLNSTVKYVDFAFNSIVVDPTEDFTTVIFKDKDGNVISQSSAFKNSTVAPPSIKTPSGNGWTAYTEVQWLDEQGNPADFDLGEEAEYVFIAGDPIIGDNAPMVAYVEDLRFSFSYYSQFHMFFYLPVNDVVDARPAVSGVNDSSATVLIGGNKYWTYTVWGSTARIAEDQRYTITFSIDGVEYTQSFIASALIYADIVLSDPTSDLEAAAVANMVRYIREARDYAKLADIAKFDELIGSRDGSVKGLYTLPEYAEEYPYSDLDCSNLSEYVESFSLKISNGTPAFKITLTDKANKLKITRYNFSLVIENGTKLDIFDYAKDGYNYETNNVKVYNAIQKITITLNVPEVKDEATGEVITPAQKIVGEYSVGTYIKGVESQGGDASVAKAMYAFGVAAKAYRNSRTDY